MRLFLTALLRYGAFLVQLLASPFRDGRRLAGTLLLLVGLPLFVVLQLLHWFGFLLDELFFRGYRRVDIRKPLFIVGPPRSGTTHLHHVLSADPDTTTFRTWECLFGLSVTARKLLLGLGRLDRTLGRPFSRITAWFGKRGSAMDDIHPISLADPEEDFLCLLPAAACFLLVVPFPRSAWLWRTARLDTELPPDDRARLMGYYRRCIQKHLYVFGPDKRFLSKNASFSGAVRALLDEFPDARVLYTVRDPAETVPSQLSALRPALSLCGFPRVGERLCDELVRLLAFYYEHLADVARDNPDRMAMLYNVALRENLAATVLEALARIGLPAGDEFRHRLQEFAAASRTHSSSHHYSLEEFGLENDDIRQQFGEVYGIYDFATRSGAGTTTP